MLWTVEKLDARIRELAEFRYREPSHLPKLRWKLDESGEVGAYPSEDGDWNEIAIGDRWQGRDVYYWLAADVLVPPEWAGRKVLARFDLGSTGGGNNSGFESLLFLNGKPYQGVDQNHDEVFLPEQAAGTTLSMRLRLWSGLGGYTPGRIMEHQLARAELTWLDESTDDLYYTARVTLETVKQLGENTPERHLLLSALDRTFLLLDWSRPGSDGFYTSVIAARDMLRIELERLPNHHPVTVQGIGHTHIDIAWLWRLRHAREKAARSFSTVLRLMELDADYVFLQTTPQLYAYLKEDYPEIYAQIQERIREGRWEAGGAMWVEADCILPSGESLVRQLLYGTRFFREEFGVECRYLWLPDVFGYSWALPQILKKSGIETFMTTKMSWNQTNRMPHDTFMWRGIDGTEIMTHLIETPNPRVTPGTVHDIWNGYKDKAWNAELLYPYGYGDGGGGVNREMLEMRRRLADMPGLPRVTSGRVDDYFDRLLRRLQETDRYVHKWDGELYLETHRGTYTSQAYTKRINRKLELRLREAELLGVLASLRREDVTLYRREELETSWTIVLRNQFHDIIPGSSIREVYADSREEYSEAAALVEGAWKAAAGALVEDSPALQTHAITVFNNAGWNRQDLLHLSAVDGIPIATAEGLWRDGAGKALESQQARDGGWIIAIPGAPSLGYLSLYFSPTDISTTDSNEIPFQYDQDRRYIRTPYYELLWNEAGQWTRVYDRIAGRDVLAAGARGNVLQVFEDKPKGRHEAWDIDLFYQEKQREVTDMLKVELVELGPLRIVLHFSWRYMDSTIDQDLILYRDSRRIDLDTRVDWHEQRQLLKAAFPVAVRSTEATYDIQFGNLKRPTHWNTSWDYARFESVGHQWADLSEHGYGVSLLNDCKYGYDIREDVLRLTLIKSALVPDATADQGFHEFRYALLPHEQDWVSGDTVREAWSLNNPLTWTTGAAAESVFSFLQIGGYPHILVDAVKLAEDSDAIVIRLHEYAGGRGMVCLKAALPSCTWQSCDLMERPSGPVVQEEELSFAIAPYELRTFLMRRG
ncbi:alpha-mannosidase [Paenibacillus koleovorans]|uniref:alpha-mannosidase n=1 Tax=Paenibacillus koleovorans TaxID=121608 RepID=UPI000FD766AA|nr:alpha-mannosidase [Paenibacillus koleovorans]